MVAPANLDCAMARDLGVAFVCAGSVRSLEGVGCISECSLGVRSLGVRAAGSVTALGEGKTGCGEGRGGAAGTILGARGVGRAVTTMYDR